jgi:hypothetical protein
MTGNRKHLNEDQMEENFLKRQLSGKGNADVFVGNTLENYEKNRKENKIFIDSYAIIRDVARLATFYRDPDQLEPFPITDEKVVKRCINIVKEFEPDILNKKRSESMSPKFFDGKKQITQTEDPHQKNVNLFSKLRAHTPNTPKPRGSAG